MPEIITLYRVFLATPSDVIEERGSIEEILHEWNLQHGQIRKTRVELVSWHTHAFPATGDRGQGLINKQALDSADIVVGIFWLKFGSPTGKANSGTEEEIRRSIKQGKKVMVYFSKRAIAPDRFGKSSDQKKIERFKKVFGKKALYWEYSDLDKFDRDFRNHLAQQMNELLPPITL